MTPRAATTLLLALLLAGCTLGAEESGPGDALASCRDEGEATPSAPLLATMQEDPELLARRLAEAMGTHVTGAPQPLEGGDLRWEEDGAIVTVRRAEDGVLVQWLREGAWDPSAQEAHDTLRRALAAFEPPDPEAFLVERTNEDGPIHLRARQTHDGRPLAESGASLASGPGKEVSVLSLREVRPGLDLLPEARATELAVQATRCALDQRGDTEALGHRVTGADPPGLGAKGASLAWVVRVNVAEPEGPSHCGHVEVAHVDAVSGKLLGLERPACD